MTNYTIKIRTILVLLVISLNSCDVSNEKPSADHIEKASTNDFAPFLWLAGKWEAHALGGTAEEIWHQPRGNAMMFSFRLIKDNTVLFYEFGAIIKQENQFVLKLRHFNADLTAWEEKNQSIDFKLTKVTENEIVSEELKYERNGNKRMTVTVHPNTDEELVFNYKKRD